MAAVVIIPARYASTRLPGKPLLERTGKPLIQHVVESVRAARRIERIAVATDDERIAKCVEGFGGEAIMTGADCRTGTDRVAEAAGKL
ncbi:MAG: 3-deoxy-manno-octulosonate cytidylyltransferase, partial [Phycisphaerae bacterium]|nr:3-deoxy-manno-octulosonate cytidylyltransferase [Phycisphaerae bacterium]